MVLAFYGQQISQEQLARLLQVSKKYGTARKQLVRIAKKLGFRVIAQHRGTVQDLLRHIRAGCPVIVNYLEPSDNEGHYAVVVGFRNGSIILNDPWNGRGFKIPLREFLKRWRGTTPAGAPYSRWWMTMQCN
ncbi:MAG: hypothetical protein A3B31_03750 [Candidatus Komeilibacteria bacterium RIFCSPLOWO2_01_FULL_53_11]|uniref:Peptidase C39 domain-containing protein n=1 Tax=Candidatus Komeilibacteria bacterium RIFCSPLOWO2_01_FULL_53_11 TaxID=1798552 RepID=A0A1G2BPK7_9BACT|nr:MAG: hypothetical protein A3B31_03750 [Candidatus Komeilibacteria bacterium RIFCSPLOWO2_01_FULL_53_11]